MEIRAKRTKSSAQAMDTLMARCARAEVCVSDARRLLVRWEVPSEEHDMVVERLVKERFIDERRYARAFVNDKIKFSHWGVRKISDTLYRKRIPPAIISEVLSEVDRDGFRERLREDLERKLRSVKDGDPRKVRDKLIRFAISRGYEPDLVFEMVEEVATATQRE